MPEKETVERAKQELRQGKSPKTAAGEFIREEIHHIREGKHGAASTEQAIAIGLSKARRAGVPLAPPPGERAPKKKRAAARGTLAARTTSRRRARASLKRLKKKPHRAASKAALSRHAKRVARKRSRAR